MSLIHLDKSVLSFHFKEIVEDGHFGGPLTLVGLVALMFGPRLLSNSKVSNAASTSKIGQSHGCFTSPYRPGISLSGWVSQTQQQAAATADHRPALEVTPQAQASDQLAA